MHRKSTPVKRSIRLLHPLLMIASAAAAAIASSCSAPRTPDPIAAYRAYDRPAKLPNEPSQVRVKVSLDRQRAYVMEGSEILLTMPISVGKASTPTPTGTFHIYQKDTRRRHHEHGYAYRGELVRQCHVTDRPSGWSFKGSPMPYWCEFKPSYGFHTGWLKHHPCTEGSIRMHENLAPKFFRLVSIGTQVHIARSQPEDLEHADIPLPPDAGPLPDHTASMYLGERYFSYHNSPQFE